MTRLEEIINQYGKPAESWEPYFTKSDVIAIAEQAMKEVLEKAAENAVTFIPSHKHLHGIKAVDKSSITSTTLD